MPRTMELTVDSLRGFLASIIVNGHAEPGAGQCAGDRGTDAARSAGDKGREQWAMDGMSGRGNGWTALGIVRKSGRRVNLERYPRLVLRRATRDEAAFPAVRRPAAGFHCQRARSIPPGGTDTPSCSSRATCVHPDSPGSDTVPLELTTLCQGTGAPGGKACRAYPTNRARPGMPRSFATWPYVATAPRGMRDTSAHTSGYNGCLDRAMRLSVLLASQLKFP